jgi:hypothetical protein
MSNDKRWQDMTPDEQAVAIRQISGAFGGCGALVGRQGGTKPRGRGMAAE